MSKPLMKIFIIFTLLANLLYSEDINLDVLIESTTQTDKKMLLYLHRTGCSYCNSMQEFTLEDEDIKEYLKDNFNFITVNISENVQVTYKGSVVSGLELARLLGYDFYPSLLLFDSNKEIKSATVGYKNESEFMVILKYLKSGVMDTMTLKEYKSAVEYKNNNAENEIVDERKRKNAR